MQWLPATQAIRKALCGGSTPPIQEVVDLGAVPRLVHLMTLAEDPALQLEAAWAVCNVASGNSAQCTAVVESGALPPAFKLLQAERPDLREQAAWLLGNVVGDGAALRDQCLDAGLLPPLLAAMEAESEIKPLRQYVWLLLNVTRFKPRQRKALLEVLPFVARLAASTSDDETLADAMSALAHIADDCIGAVVMDARAAVQRAGKLVNDPATPNGVVLPAAKVLSALCAGDAVATQLVVDTGVLTGGYKRLLEQSSAAGLLMEVCFALSNIAAGTKDQATAVRDAGLVPLLVAVFKRCPTANTVHREATWTLANLTNSLPSLAQSVLESGAAVPLTEYLCSHAAKSQRADVKSTVAAAEALLGMAQASAQSPGSSTDSGDGAARPPPLNPAMSELYDKGLYEKLQSTLDRGLLTGAALTTVKRLLADFPPPSPPPPPASS